MKKDKRESLRKAHVEYRKWEDSLEGVAYWLGDIQVPETLERLIVRTVHRLPSEAREFTYDNCRFTAVNDTGVRIRHIPQTRQPWLITLGQGPIDESLLVHEIAHAWLGHEYGFQHGDFRVTQRDEEAACDLTRKWGFGGGSPTCSARVR